MNKLCEVCESGYLVETVCANTVTYQGVSRDLDCLYSICSLCANETATPEQTRINKQVALKFRQEVDHGLH